MKGKFTGAIVLVVATGLLMATMTLQSVSAQDAQDELNVTVNITEKTIVDIQPDSLNWIDPLEPGEVGGPGNESSGYGAIQIENKGSTNLTNVWLENTKPTQMPFGTADSSLYDAGNWLTAARFNKTLVQPEGEFFFPDRREFEANEPVVYLIGPNGNSPPSVPYGRFRNSSYEWFWAADCDASNCSDGGSNDLYVTSQAHTQQDTSANLDTNGDSFTIQQTSNSSWGVADVDLGGTGDHTYCVAVKDDASETRWYKWNMDAPGAGTCTYASDLNQGNIVPGSSAYGSVRVFVPYGVPVGDGTYSGDLTVYVSAAN